MTMLLGLGIAGQASAQSSNGGAQAPDGSNSSQASQSQSGQAQPSQGQTGATGPSGATGPTGANGPDTGGSAFGGAPSFLPELTVPGTRAKIMHGGLAAAPANAPAVVQQAIWTANQIVGRPYIYGGGHGAFAAAGYDCSGTVSYALHGGNLLRAPLDSSDFETWGWGGHGQWITVYTNPGHAYMNIAGIRLDTSSADDPSGRRGPQWRRVRHSNRGFLARHPLFL